jgi:hypothetical protein
MFYKINNFIHAQHEHSMTPQKANGTKCLKMLIGHHYMNVQSRKSIWTLMVGGCSFAFSMWHGDLSRMKKTMNEKKKQFSDG